MLATEVRPYNAPTFNTLIGDDIIHSSNKKKEKKSNRFSLRNLKFLSPTSSAMIPPIGTDSTPQKKAFVIPSQKKQRPKSQVLVWGKRKSTGK